MTVRAYIDSFHGGTAGEPERCTLTLEYDGKEARLEIPVPEPLSSQESAIDAYRREVSKVIAALQEAVDSPQGIDWPYRHGN